MGWQYSKFFKTICRVVLITFYFQTLHVGNLGYRSGDWGLNWHLGFNEAAADDSAQPPTPSQQNQAPAAPTTQQQSLAPGDYLSPTPDANSADPYIIQKAQELGNNPAQIFAFVRDEIGYESYKGSLRGARGTLWSKAGNSLDKASLMIALLRASGIEARYAGGILSDAGAQKMILSMFPSPLRVSGFIEPGKQLADPVNDQKLLAETKEHYWVEFGAGFQAADPSFGDTATIGQTFASGNTTFNEVPDALRHKVTVRVKRETVSLLANLFGSGIGLDVKPVLTRTFIAAEMAGKPLIFGHFVSQSSFGFVLTATTNTYTPYLVISDQAQPSKQNETITGEAYQETLTNFPLGSQILTGVFLETDLAAPDGTTEHYTRSPVDRIGVDVRKNGGQPNLNLPANAPPALTEFDVSLLQVGADSANMEAVAFEKENLQTLSLRLEQAQANIGALPSDPAQTTSGQIDKLRTVNNELLRGFGGTLDWLSDYRTQSIGEKNLVRAYFDKPRLTIVSSHLQFSEDFQSVRPVYAIDLLRDSIRSLAFPGQNHLAERAFLATRGLTENLTERDTLITLSQDVSPQLIDKSSVKVIEEALNQNIDFVTITPENLSLLDSLELPAEAKARMTDAIGQGKVIVAPAGELAINGEDLYAWYDINPTTAEAIGVSKIGANYTIGEWAAAIAFVGFIGYVAYQALTAIVQAVTDFIKTHLHTQLSIPSDNMLALADLASDTVTDVPIPLLLADANSVPVTGTINTLSSNDLLDLSAPLRALDSSILVTPIEQAIGTPLLETSSQKTGDYLAFSTQATDFGNLVGDLVAMGIVNDPNVKVPFGGVQLSSAFKVGIKNLSGKQDTFRVTFTNIPAGFEAIASVPEIQIPDGETAETGVYLRPLGAIPAPGTVVSFDVEAVSTTDPSITTVVTQDFVVPEIHGLAFTSNPPAVNAIPGQAANAVLSLKAVGNVEESVSLVASLPADLTLDGLSTLTLNPGDTTTLPITLIPSAATALNTTLTATITANFSSSEPQTLVIPVFVAAPGAQAIADASVAVGQLGKTDLSNRLNDLSMAMNRLVQNADDQVAKSQVLAALDSIIKQLSADPFLSEFVDEFMAAKLALEAAGTPDEILAALNGIGSSLNAFGTTTTQLRLHNFEASLSPPSIEAQPNVPASVGIRIRNTGSAETTYNLSFENLPADTTGAFNQTSVTLLPGQLSNDITASLTRTTGNELLPASFNVRVTAQQAPAVSHLIEGNLTVRTEFVSVASVTASPPFVNPKVTPPVLMFISVKILNAVNKARDALVSFKVKDSNGQEVFASSPVNTTLSVQTALTEVDLGAFNPQGLPEGTYTAEVSVTDADGTLIPGGTGTANLLLGSPVTAGLSNDPDKLPPGTSTVTHTLKINSQLILPPLAVEGQIHIPSSGTRSGVAVKDNIAYTCSANGIQLFDVTDPALPHWLKTVGSGENIGCKIQGDLLLSLQPTNGGYSAHLLHVYSLKSDPLNPVLLGTSTPINYGLQYDLASNAGGAFIAQFEWCNILNNNDIYIQTGDLLSVPFNLDNTVNPTSASPALSDVLFNTHGDLSNDGTDVPGCPANGGDGNVWQLAVVDENTLLMATTSIQGTDTQAGGGVVKVIDISDRANISVMKEVLIPGTAHVTGIAVDGDRALIVSSTGGWRDFFSNSDPNNDPLLTGNLVFSTLLLTDPRNPILLSSQSISRQSRTFWNGGLTALGNGRFAYSSLGGVNDSKQIIMVDANDPFNLVFGQTNVPAENIGPNAITASGDLIYTTNATGDLIIYKLPDLPVVPVKASVKVPKNTGVTVDSNSFTEAPSEIIQGNDFDTLVWDRNLTAGSSLLLNWQTTVDNLQPGEARQTTQGGTVDFTFENTTGQVPLSPTTVVSEQLLTLDPATQTVHPGATALYNLTVKNPSASPVSYALSIQGIPASWAQMDTPLLLEANEERTIGLSIAVEPFTATGLRSLVITAQGDNGARGAVQGDLLIEGDAVIPDADINAHGVIMTLTPSNATAGQGTSARYTVRVINTGSSTETFRLDTAFLQANFVSVFDSPVITVPPGASNFRDAGLTVTPPADTPPADYPFSVQAVFDANNEVGTTSQGLLSVVNAGVSLAFNPVTGDPGETLSLNITNTGTIEDDFMLSLVGPGGFISSLSDPSVHLLPGAFTTVGVKLGDVSFALPGKLTLFARATSVYNSAVQAISQASIKVAERKGLSATLDPAVVELTAPGAKDFLIKVKNTGNAEDAYRATITQVAGPISASLTGLDGNPAQSIPVFRLPALADGSLNLGISLNTTGIGTVKVLISSNTEPSIQQELTAQLGLAELNQAPNADAGQNKNVFTGVPSALDGSASNDPDGDLISYQWRFVSVPAGSVLGDDSIVNNQTSVPLITPDIAGVYRLELIVSDGISNSSPAYVELTAANANVPPNAIAGLDQTVLVGGSVALDGSLSQDQDNGPAPLSFNWSFITVPATSALDNDLISSDPQNPAKAFFTPDVKGAYELKLRVSDGEVFDDDTLTVTATLANVPPVANAGVDLIIQSGGVVNLNAELSSDSDQSPSPLSFSWKFVSLPENSGLTNGAIVADHQNPARASFTPDQAGDYVLEVEVSDGEAISSDNILVKVLPALRYQDISDLFRVTPSNEKTVLNRKTRKLTSSVTLTLNNISALDIKTPVRVLFRLTSSAVSIPGTVIDQNSGQPYLELPGNLIPPGGTEVLNVQFVYPTGTQFTYDSKVFGTVAR